jgi:hypothetical protein
MRKLVINPKVLVVVFPILFNNYVHGQLGAPSLLNPANGVTVNIGSTLNFSWSAISGATSYEVQFDAGTGYVSSVTVSGTSLSIVVQAVSIGSHTWHVRARNATTVGSYSTTRTYTVTLGTPTLSAPANGITVNVGSTLIFSWSTISGATSYDVEFDAGTGYVSTTNVSGTSLSIVVQAVSVGSHTWHVRARNGSSTGSYSTTRTYTVVGTLGTPTLSAPANGITVNVGSNLNFSWSAVSGATSYDVEFDAGTGYVSTTNVSGTSLSIVVQAVSIGSHAWHVRARNSTTIGSYSATRTYTVTLGTPTLSAPADGITVNVGSTLNFSWSAVGSATSYDVEFDGGTGYVSTTNVSGTSLSIVVQAVSIGSHTWHVRAKNGTSTGTYSITRTYTVVSTLGTPTLSAPANGITVNVGSTLNFSWSTISGATSYDVEFDAGTGYVSTTNVSGTSLSIVAQVVSIGSHTWHVRAKNATTTGAYSTTRTYTVVSTLGTPTLSAPTDGVTVNVGSTLNFSWSTVSGATSYDVEFDAGTGYVSTTNVLGTSLSIVVQAVSIGSHTWHVRARNATTNGAYSATRKYTVTDTSSLGTPILSAPADGVSVNVGSTVNFSWSAVSGATSYDVELDDGTVYVSSTNVTTNSLNVVVQAVSIGPHTWRVRARNTSTTGNYSATRTYTVVATGTLGIPNLSTPADGTTVIVGNTLNFSWSAVSGATSYDVEFDAGTGHVTSTNVSSITLNVVAQSANIGAHTWHVRARNATTTGSYSSSRIYNVTSPVGLGIPTLLTPTEAVTANVGSTLNFSWSAVSLATSYDIEFDAGTGHVSTTTVSGTTWSTMVKDANVGSHTWHVRAKNALGTGGYSLTRTYVVAAPCPLNMKWYSQRDDRWGYDVMNGNCLIRDVGCVISCISMMLASQVGNQESDYTPKTLNTYLNTPPLGYNSNCGLDWTRSHDMDGIGGVIYEEHNSGINNWAWLDNQLSQCRKVVVHVSKESNMSEGSHWVLVVGKTAANTNGSSYKVLDPGTQYSNWAVKTLGDYHNRYFKGHSYSGTWKTDFPDITSQTPASVNTVSINEYTTMNVPGTDGFLTSNITPTTQSNTVQNPIQLRIFPNPATGENITVEFYNPAAYPLLFEIRDEMGRLNNRIQITAPAGMNIYQLPVGLLANGIYLLSVRTKTETTTKKFIINR